MTRKKTGEGREEGNSNTGEERRGNTRKGRLGRHWAKRGRK